MTTPTDAQLRLFGIKFAKRHHLDMPYRADDAVVHAIETGFIPRNGPKECATSRADCIAISEGAEARIAHNRGCDGRIRYVRNLRGPSVRSMEVFELLPAALCGPCHRAVARDAGGYSRLRLTSGPWPRDERCDKCGHAPGRMV